MYENLKMNVEEGHGVGKTALLVAACRALASEKEDPVISDPFARELAQQEGFALLESLGSYFLSKEQSLEMLYSHTEARTKTIDEFVLQHPEIKQIVIPASGLDARFFRLKIPSDTKGFEIDYPEVLDYKDNILNKHTPVCERICIGADLSNDSWIQKLIDSGYNPTIPSLWFLEGFIMYLDENQAYHFLETISKNVAEKSVILVHSHKLEIFGKSPITPIAQIKFGTPDPPESLLSKYFSKVQVITADTKDTMTFIIGEK